MTAGLGMEADALAFGRFEEDFLILALTLVLAFALTFVLAFAFTNFLGFGFLLSLGLGLRGRFLLHNGLLLRHYGVGGPA